MEDFTSDLGNRLVKRKTTLSDSVARTPSTISPKLRVVQSMLQDIVSDSAPDATMIFSHTLPSRAGDNRAHASADPRIAKIPGMILQGQTLAALATCHEVEQGDCQGMVAAQLSNVSDLRRCLEQELLATDIEFVASDLRLCPIPKRSVLIGRPSTERAAEIAINCRWFSRADKSLKLSSDGAEWFVEDLGSANGSFIGEKRLQRTNRHTLLPGQTTLEIGRSFDRRSPVILNFDCVNNDVVVVSASVGAAFDKSGWHTWPSLQEDLAKRWLVFRDEFTLGSDYTSKALGLAASDVPAVISFSNGFWITPHAGHEIRINNVAFRSTVPIPVESDLSVGALELRIERAPDGITRSVERLQQSGGVQQ